MPTPSFAEMDSTSSDLMQNIIGDVSKRYTDNMALESQLKQDQADKVYSQRILDSYIANHNPRKVERVHPVTGEKEIIEKYPTIDETFRLATQARAALAQSGGRHSAYAADQIGKDLDARLRYQQRSPKADELQSYIDQYGPEMGLQMFNKAQVQRRVAPVEARSAGEQKLEETKQKGREELAGINFGYRLKLESVKAEKAFSPVELDNGNLGVTWHNPITHQAGVYDTGVKGTKLEGKNTGKGGKVTTNEWFKVWQPVMDAELRAVSMMHSEQEANAGKARGPNDTNLLFNHMGMTLSAQKGTRITYAEIDNAIKARSFPEDIMELWDKVSTGGFLSPAQRRYFVELAMRRRMDFVTAARRAATAIKMDPTTEPKFNPELPPVEGQVSRATGGATDANAGQGGAASGQGEAGTAPSFQLQGEKGSYNWDAEDSEYFKSQNGHYPTQQEAEAEAKAGGHI